jgi:hypothetical protein
LAELFFAEFLTALSTTPSTAATAAPAAASAARLAADAARDALDEDFLRARVAAAFLPAALRLVLLERELLLRAGAI